MVLVWYLASEVWLPELTNNVLKVGAQLLLISAIIWLGTIYLLLINLVNLQERSLDRSKAEHEAEAHVEERCLKVDVLYPNLS